MNGAVHNKLGMFLLELSEGSARVGSSHIGRAVAEHAGSSSSLHL